MKKSLKTIPLLLGMLSLAACEDGLGGLFRREANHARVPYEPKPVVVGFISPQDTMVRVQVRYSEPSVGFVPDDRRDSDDIENATVTLSNGEKTVTLPYDPRGWKDFHISTREFAIEPGRTYLLKVTTPDGMRAEAACTVPASRVDFQTVRTSRDRDSSMTLRWQDIAGQRNYYSLFGQVIDRRPDGTRRIASESGYHGLSDENNDGGTITSPKMGFGTTQYYSDGSGQLVEMVVCTTDWHYYEFHRTLENQRYANENIFAEPSPIYTNVAGGLGVFAGYNQLRIRI